MDSGQPETKGHDGPRNCIINETYDLNNYPLSIAFGKSGTGWHHKAALEQLHGLIDCPRERARVFPAAHER